MKGKKAGKDRSGAKPAKKPERKTEDKPDEGMRLNKFIAHSGLCSRRKADEYIQAGLVEVNGVKVLEMGYKVNDRDKITFKGKPVKRTRSYVYILLNKPKDTLSTTDDPHGRNTVLELIRKATDERVYPVGRLDRNTTGLLLLTNDGELANKLSHPRYEVQKIYLVELDKELKAEDLRAIRKGLVLDDGPVQVDDIQFPDPSNKKVIGVELHSGRNRIVRRIFESLGYEVKKLDRVMYAGLTKRKIPRGTWRYLTKQEVIHLKHFSGKNPEEEEDSLPAEGK